MLPTNFNPHCTFSTRSFSTTGSRNYKYEQSQSSNTNAIMVGLGEKIKNALQGEKNTPEAAAANKGHNGTVSLLNSHDPSLI